MHALDALSHTTRLIVRFVPLRPERSPCGSQRSQGMG
jgi:hypothetical protein